MSKAASAEGKQSGLPAAPRYHPMTRSAGAIPWVWDGYACDGQGHWFVDTRSRHFKPWMAAIKPVSTMTLVMQPLEVATDLAAANVPKPASWDALGEDPNTP